MATITALRAIPQTTEPSTTEETPPRLPRLGSIARRRWPVLVLLPLLALVIAGVNYALTPRSFTARGQMTVTDQSRPADDSAYAKYYVNLSSEAATDDLIRILPGSVFAADVAARLQTQGIFLTTEQVQQSLDTARVFRVLTVDARANNQDRAMVICRAAVDTLVAKSPDYFPNRPVRVLPIDLPLKATSRSLQAQVVAAGTVAAAVLAAVVIALLLELLDTRLHDRRDVADLLGVPVVGVVPRRPGKAT